jgi:hypothetical protein
MRCRALWDGDADAHCGADGGCGGAADARFESAEIISGLGARVHVSRVPMTVH